MFRIQSKTTRCMKKSDNVIHTQAERNQWRMISNNPDVGISRQGY